MQVALNLFAGLQPNERIGIADHAKKHYRLTSEGGNPKAGPFDVSWTPYLQEIMESLQIGNGIETVVFMKGCQIGGTSVSLCTLLHTANNSPKPTLVVFPTERNAERFVKKKFKPMVQNCRNLQGLMEEFKTEKSTLELFNFPGCSIGMGNAHAANSMRMDSCQMVILDEVSDFPANCSGQGDPVAIAIGRTSTFEGRKKIYLVSTPSKEESCRITKAYKDTDQRKYFVSCPHCNHMQIIEWKRIAWEKGNTSNIWLKCENSDCGEKIRESAKTKLLAKGKWIATVKDKSGGRKRGYHLSGLYSPLGMKSWSTIANEFLDAKDNPNMLEVWTNNNLGEPWYSGHGISNNVIKKRISNYKYDPLPKEVGLITCGVDINKRLSNIEVVGWGEGRQSWGLQYKRIDIPVTDPRLWSEIDKVIFQQFHHPMGHKLTPYITAIDTGYEADQVYDYVRDRLHTASVIGIKGIAGEGKPIISARATYKNKGQIPLFNVCLDSSLETLYSWLAVKTPGPHYCNFPRFYKDTENRKLGYFDEINAFVKVSKYIKGVQKNEWHQKEGTRKEANDCRRYALAALFYALRLGVDLDQWCADLNRYTPEEMAKVLEGEDHYGLAG